MLRKTASQLSLCRVATVPFALYPLLGQFEYLSKSGISVTVVCSPVDDFSAGAHQSGASTLLRWHSIPIARPIRPVADLIALLRLYRFFRAEKFDVVHSTTPKAGLLTSLAAWAARVPVRLHTFTGQTWVEERGLLRMATRLADRCIGWLSTGLYADGKGQAKFLVDEGIVPAGKIHVLLEGSLAGVDLGSFCPKRWQGSRHEIRRQLQIPGDAFCFVFAGRFHRDKGIGELLEAFLRISEQVPQMHLLIIGPRERTCDWLKPEIATQLQNHPRLHPVGYVEFLEPYLAASDAMCLPSYREGYNGAILQAAALELPTLGSDIYGINDNLVPGETGVLVPPKDVDRLAAAMLEMVVNRARTRQMGLAARRRIETHFDSRVLERAVGDEYRRLVRSDVDRAHRSSLSPAR